MDTITNSLLTVQRRHGAAASEMPPYLCTLAGAHLRCARGRLGHSAFTLVELLVVIAIIGILAGVLMATFSGGSESARAARCLTNMKNLANACQVYAMKASTYPTAGSREVMTVDTSSGRRRSSLTFTEYPGWISWDSQGGYQNGTSKSHRSNATIGLYSDDKEKSLYALTNGCLWKFVSQNRETYVCPSHVRKAGKSTRPNWSYFMNGYFGWDVTKGSSACASDDYVIWYNTLARADRRLLFAEIPFMGYSTWQPEGTGGSEQTDAILQYAASDLAKGEQPTEAGNETIGANHVQGKNLIAHVVFADGHVEKLRIPYAGTIKSPKADDAALLQLTSWLCAGKDVSYDGKQYKKMTSN